MVPNNFRRNIPIPGCRPHFENPGGMDTPSMHDHGTAQTSCSRSVLAMGGIFLIESTSIKNEPTST